MNLNKFDNFEQGMQSKTFIFWKELETIVRIYENALEKLETE